jgi:NAD(P)-dependent dehydrogenase (short-subunit alcohol dehydrogenase family)
LSASPLPSPSPSPTRPIAVVTGASAGLGLAIAKAFVTEGYIVVGVARDEAKLLLALEQIDGKQIYRNAKSNDESSTKTFHAIAADVANPQSVASLFQEVENRFQRLDVLVNCVGQSDRGSVLSLEPQRIAELIHTNVATTLLCSQAAFPMLKDSRGSIINVGSLASKVGARHLGAYPAAKHALAGLTQQMRLEWREHGVHVALVSPGPIRRQDAGVRYRDRTSGDDIPDSAHLPGGGTSIKGLDPDWIAKQIVGCVKRRTPDIVLPRYARFMIALGHLFPTLGDRLLLAMTKGK